MSGIAIIAVALPALGAVYVLGTFALGIAAAWMGYLVGRRLS
jgi:hypothetical protein